MNTSPETKIIRVAILEDHPGTIDGYMYRFAMYPSIEVVATARFGDQLDEMLANHVADVLILDVGVPASAGKHTPYPLFNVLPRLKKQYPQMAVLIISAHKQRTLIRAVMDAGARGYIIKDDEPAILNLGQIATSLAAGGVYLSQQSFEALREKPGGPDDVEMLTERQREVLSLCAANPGLTTERVAKQLGIADSTLRNLLSNSYKRLKVNNLTSAIIKARDLGLITPMEPRLDE